MNSPHVAPDGLPEDTAVHDGAGVGRIDDLDQRLVAAVERMGHVTRTMLQRQAYAAGVSPLQHQLLFRMRTLDRGARGSDLATELDVSQATASEALSTLRRKGLIEKDQDLADRRNVVYSLTADGTALCDRLTTWDAPLTAHLDTVDEADKATALRVLLGLVADLHDEGFVSVARTCLTCRFFGDGTAATGLPHRCDLLEVDFDDAHLRVDCGEHQARTATA